MEGLLAELVEGTAVAGEDAPSLSSGELQRVNCIVAMVVDHLMLDLESNPDQPFPLSMVRASITVRTMWK